jgi:NRPS condensation-like uncharacterized protein
MVEKYALEIEIFTLSRGFRAQISRSGAQKTHFQLSVRGQSGRTDFFNSIGRFPPFVTENGQEQSFYCSAVSFSLVNPVMCSLLNSSLMITAALTIMNSSPDNVFVVTNGSVSD